MSYLIDTNACIALINGTPATVRHHFDVATRADRSVFLSSISAFELWYGVFKSPRQESNASRLSDFFKRGLEMLPFDDVDARISGEIRAALQKIGTPIGVYDLLLAGQALNRNLTLVTANVSEFSRVQGLSWKDWSRH